MATTPNRPSRGRRQFLKQSLGVAAAAAATPAAALAGAATPVAEPAPAGAPAPAADLHARIAYPRVFTGTQLSQIAFPLGGIGTGCISLGGRGQLRDWEIFNRPDQGLSPGYVFPSIRVQQGSSAPFVSVLEARLRPPYQGAFGLGSNSAPGLQRLESARFTGEFPLAHIAFRDRRLRCFFHDGSRNMGQRDDCPWSNIARRHGIPRDPGIVGKKHSFVELYSVQVLVSDHENSCHRPSVAR